MEKVGVNAEGRCRGHNINLLQLIDFLRCISVLKGFMQEEKLQKVFNYMASKQMETGRDQRVERKGGGGTLHQL